MEKPDYSPFTRDGKQKRTRLRKTWFEGGGRRGQGGRPAGAPKRKADPIPALVVKRYCCEVLGYASFRLRAQAARRARTASGRGTVLTSLFASALNQGNIFPEPVIDYLLDLSAGFF
jgi:hypothetical protein